MKIIISDTNKSISLNVLQLLIIHNLDLTKTKSTINVFSCAQVQI